MATGVREWEALRAGLFEGLGTLGVERDYGVLRAHTAALSPFSSAGDLVVFLHNAGGDLDAKDRVYAALVKSVHASTPSAQLAMRLIWVGLWPGLDGIFRRWRRVFSPRVELPSELSSAFAHAIGGVDAPRCRRLAATLVRGAERNLRRAVERRARSDAPLAARFRAPLSYDPEASPFGFAEGLPEAQQVARLKAWFGEVGVDGNLVLRAVLLEHARRELGQELGVPSYVARKRIERALRRARERLDEKTTEGVSQPDPQGGVSPRR